MDNECSSQNMDVFQNLGRDRCFTSSVGVGDDLDCLADEFMLVFALLFAKWTDCRMVA